jgi:hypothetical protein
LCGFAPCCTQSTARHSTRRLRRRVLSLPRKLNRPESTGSLALSRPCATTALLIAQHPSNPASEDFARAGALCAPAQALPAILNEQARRVLGPPVQLRVATGARPLQPLQSPWR